MGREELGNGVMGDTRGTEIKIMKKENNLKTVWLKSKNGAVSVKMLEDGLMVTKSFKTPAWSQI